MEERRGTVIATPEAYKRWLESKAPDEVVGLPRDPARDPVANFLRERTKVQDIFVGPSRIFIGQGRIWTPLWVWQYIVELGKQTEPVTATQALEVLSQVMDMRQNADLAAWARLSGQGL